jgi:ribosomal protein S18 acetylase RimI-like enzyme
MIVREARLEDVPGVLGLWALARSAHAVTPDRPEDVERLVREMPGSLLVAATDDGPLIGVLIAAWDGWRGNMYRLAVHPDHRRHGVARALVQAGEAQLRRRGARRVSALVAREDEVAGGLWAAAGYAYDDVIGRFVRNL